MIKALVFTICQSVAVDGLSNRLSLFHLIDGVSAPAFPAALPPMTVVLWAERAPDDPSTGTVTLRIRVAGNVLSKMPVELNFQDKLRTRAIVELGGLVAERPCEIEIDLTEKKRVIADWTMPVSSTSAPRVTEPRAIESTTTKSRLRKLIPKKPTPKKA